MDTNVLDFSYRGENVVGKEKTLIMSSFFSFLYNVFISTLPQGRKNYRMADRTLL